MSMYSKKHRHFIYKTYKNRIIDINNLEPRKTATEKLKYDRRWSCKRVSNTYAGKGISMVGVATLC